MDDLARETVDVRPEGPQNGNGNGKSHAHVRVASFGDPHRRTRSRLPGGNTYDSTPINQGELVPGRQVIDPTQLIEGAGWLNIRHRGVQRDKGTLEAIRLIRDLDPMASHAVWNFLRLTNPGLEFKAYTFAADGSETEEAGAGQSLLDDLARVVGREYGGGLDQFHNVIALQLLTHGAICIEVSLRTPTEIDDWYAVDPTLIVFRTLEQDDGTYIMDMGQFQGGNYKSFNPEQVIYQPLDPDTGDPYGRPPLVGAIAELLAASQLITDVRAMGHNQGFPRLDVNVVFDKIKAAAPPTVVDDPIQFQAWCANQLSAIVSDYDNLAVDDTFIHFDYVTLGQVGGGAGSFDYGALIDVLTRRANNALKTLPILMGYNESTSETHGCYAADTDVLTRRGWLPFPDVTLNDEVACFDTEAKVLRWQKPTHLWEYDYAGEMINITGRSVDMLVTPNHRMVARAHDWGSDEWEFTTAEAMEQGGRAGRPTGLPSRKLWELPFATPFADEHSAAIAEDVSPEYARFLGYWISEGSFNGGSRFSPNLSQNEGALSDKMVETVAALGYDYRVARVDAGSAWASPNATAAALTIHLRGQTELGRWLTRECGDRAWNKHLPKVAWGWSLERKRDLFDALMQGDGCVVERRPNVIQYATTSEALADDVQRLAIELGYSAAIGRVTYKSTEAMDRSNQRDGLVVYIGNRPTINVSSRANMRRVAYDGKVYCLTVPTHAIATRRNGKYAIAGQSIQWQIQVAGIEAMQNLIKRAIEKAGNLTLRLAGIQAHCKVTYQKIRTVDRLYEAQSDFFDARNAQLAWQMGWADNDELAEKLYGHKAVADPIQQQQMDQQQQQYADQQKSQADYLAAVNAQGGLPPAGSQPGGTPGTVAEPPQTMEPPTGEAGQGKQAAAKPPNASDMAWKLALESIREPVGGRRRRTPELRAPTPFWKDESRADKYEALGRKLFLDLQPQLAETMRLNGALRQLGLDQRDLSADIADWFQRSLARQMKGLLREAVREAVIEVDPEMVGATPESLIDRIWNLNRPYVARISNDLRAAIKDGTVSSTEDLASWFDDNSWREGLMGRFVGKMGLQAGMAWANTKSTPGQLYVWTRTIDDSCATCTDRGGQEFAYEELLVQGFPGSDALECGARCFPAGTVMAGEVTGALRAWYEGEVVELETISGRRLTATPNHPVLTPAGFVPIGSLSKGQYVVSAPLGLEDLGVRGPAVAVDEQRPPSRIEEVFAAFPESDAPLARVPTRDDLHGDAAFVQGDIDVVGSYRLLPRHFHSTCPECGRKGVFMATDVGEARLLGQGPPYPPRQRLAEASLGGPRSTTLTLDVDGAAGPLQPLRVGLAAGAEPSLSEPAGHSPAVDLKLLAELKDRHPSLELADEIVRVDRLPFSGHVYDLATTAGWQGANGIIVSNCRCYLDPVFPAEAGAVDAGDRAPKRAPVVRSADRRGLVNVR